MDIYYIFCTYSVICNKWYRFYELYERRELKMLILGFVLVAICSGVFGFIVAAVINSEKEGE